MKHFRKIWDDEKNAWLKKSKGMSNNEAYALFLKTFPDAADVTRVAFCNQRSRQGAAGPSYNCHVARTPRPIGAEQVKKGYVRIKIAQPNVWVSKAKWVYMNAHPDEDLSERSNYVFLDGDNRNFAPENIERIPIKLMSAYARYGGAAKGNPQLTRIRIAQAKLEMARFDLGEKIGLVSTYHGMRAFKSDRAAAARRNNERVKADPARAERAKKHRQEYYAKKRLDPEWVEKQRRYGREWARKQRNK